MKIDELRSRLLDEANTEPVTIGDPFRVVVRRAHRARRRRRVRFAAAASTVVAVAAVAIVTASHEGGGHPKVVVSSPPERLDVVAIATQPVPGRAGEYTSALFYINADTGHMASRAIPSNNYGDYPVQLLRIGNQLLMPRGGGVRSAPFDLSKPPRDIAPALVFVPSIHPDRIWAITHFQFGNNPPFKVTEFDASGQPTTKELALPPKAGWPIAGTNEGLLIQAGLQDEVWLWDPTTGQVSRRIRGVERFQGDNWAGPDLFAWTSPCRGAVFSCAALHLLDLRTGNQHDVAPPLGSIGFVPDGSLSPDATTVAVFTTTASGRRHLVLVDVATGQTTTVPDSERNGTLVTWSPDNTTIFFGTDNATGIARYHLGDTTTQQISNNLPHFTAIITGPATSNTH